MKKVTMFLGAIALTAGMAFAQNNSSTVSQTGSTNAADVDQTGALNQGTILQGFGGQGQNGAEASIEQVGAENQATVKQRAWGNRGNDHSVTQTGDVNVAWIDAFNGDNFGTIVQDGDENYGLIQQGAATDGVATIAQEGDENQARIRQFSGSGNQGSIVQGVGAYESNNNDADILQTGSGNDASFHLTRGDYNEVAIEQTGDNNFTEFSVKYGDNNLMSETVMGDNNRTRFGINAAWGDSSSGNEVSILKDGDNNYVSGSIEGDLNTVDIMQTGNDNRIGTSWYTNDGVNIQGNGNTVGIQQMSNGNQSFNTVVGNGNSITVSQQ